MPRDVMSNDFDATMFFYWFSVFC